MGVSSLPCPMETCQVESKSTIDQLIYLRLLFAAALSGLQKRCGETRSSKWIGMPSTNPGTHHRFLKSSRPLGYLEDSGRCPSGTEECGHREQDSWSYHI